MVLQFAWVMISLFAVIGITVCIMEGLRSFSLHKIHSVEEINLQIRIKGEEPRAEYLLNSMLVLCDQLEVNGESPTLEILDGGLLPETRRIISEYCEKNPRVLFTEEGINDIMDKNI